MVEFRPQLGGITQKIEFYNMKYWGLIDKSRKNIKDREVTLRDKPLCSNIIKENSEICIKRNQ